MSWPLTFECSYTLKEVCVHTLDLGWALWFSTRPFKLNHVMTESIVRSTVRSAIAPPQARQVVGWKTKLSRKLPKLVRPQSFREDVGCLKIGVNVWKVYIPCKNKFSYEVVVHLNVLCPNMEDGVSSKMDTTEIVVVVQDWIVDGYVQIATPLYSASMLKEGKGVAFYCSMILLRYWGRKQIRRSIVYWPYSQPNQRLCTLWVELVWPIFRECHSQSFHLLKILGKLSLSYHPQSESQTEHTNQTLEQ